MTNKKLNYISVIDVDLNIGTINMQDIIEQLLYEMMSKEKIIEAFFSKNVQQRNEFWKIRELIPAANRKKGAICSNDISVPIDKIPEFIIKLDKSILSVSKDIIVNCFGHLGDGNLHYNIFPKSENSRIELENKRSSILSILNEMVYKYSGSISAEHGIGRLKTDDLHKFEDPGKLYAMKLIKSKHSALPEVP